VATQLLQHDVLTLFAPAAPAIVTRLQIIEPHIRDLVDRLNSLPGVQTISSRAGHHGRKAAGASVIFTAEPSFAHGVAAWLERADVTGDRALKYRWRLDGRWRQAGNEPLWQWRLATNDVRVPGGHFFRRFSRADLDADFEKLACACEWVSVAVALAAMAPNQGQ